MAQAADSTTSQPDPILPCPFQASQPPVGSYDSMVIINVGPEAGPTKECLAYRGLLCFQSGYFSNLLNGLFRERGSDSVRLTNVSIDIFSIFFRWLNAGPLYLSTGHIALSYREIIDAYVFGDYYAIPRFKNKSIEIFLARCYETWKFPYSEIEHIYINSSEASAMRKLVVDIAVDCFNWEGIDLDILPKEFLVVKAICGKHITIGSGKLKDGKKTQWYQRMAAHICDYHDHLEPKTKTSTTAKMVFRELHGLSVKLWYKKD